AGREEEAMLSTKALGAGRVAAACGAVPRVFFGPLSSPWLPVALYLPVAAAGVLWNVAEPRPPAWAFLVLPPVGLLFWTFVQYVMHCEAFHRPPLWGPLRPYQDSHLGHHENPKDPAQIVARLSISLPLAVLFYVLFALALWSWRLAALPFAGLTVGYLA